MSQVISFEAAQHTNKLLANSTTEEQVHSPTSTTAHKLVKKPPGRSRPGTFLTDIAFSVAASGNTTVTYAQLQARLADVVTKLITLQASINRLPKGTEPPDLPPIQLPHRVLDGNLWHWWNKKSTPTPFPRKAYSIRTASPSHAGSSRTLASLQRPHPLTKAISPCFFWRNQTQTAERKFFSK